MQAGKSREETQPKREAILEAARAIFAQKGYEETTIPEIARAANVAVGTIYLYFRNKHEILTSIAIELEKTITEIFHDPIILSLPLDEALRKIINVMFRTGRQKKDLMHCLRTTFESSEEILQQKQSNEQLTQTVDNFLQNAIAQGHLAPCNTGMYAQMLHLMGHAILLQCYGIEGGEREEMYHQMLTEFVERLFFGPSLSEGASKLAEAPTTHS